MGLPVREKVWWSLFVWIQCTRVTDVRTKRLADWRTDTGRRLVPLLRIASRGKNLWLNYEGKAMLLIDEVVEVLQYHHSMSYVDTLAILHGDAAPQYFPHRDINATVGINILSVEGIRWWHSCYVCRMTKMAGSFMSYALCSWNYKLFASSL